MIMTRVMLPLFVLALGLPHGAGQTPAAAPIEIRVADRLATELMLDRGFQSRRFPEFQLVELASAPAGVELVVLRAERDLAALGNQPLEATHATTRLAYTTQALEALLKIDGFVDRFVSDRARLKATLKQRPADEQSASLRRSVEYNNDLTEAAALNILTVSKQIDSREFVALLDLRLKCRNQILTTLKAKPELLKAFDDPSAVPTDLRASRLRVANLLEAAKRSK